MGFISGLIWAIDLSGTGITVLAAAIIICAAIIWYNKIFSRRRLILAKFSGNELNSNDRFKLLVDNIKDYAIFIVDPDGYVVSWNEGAANIKGYIEKEIIGKHISVFYQEEDIKKGIPAENLKIAKEKNRYETESWRVRKDGSRFWANVLFTAIYDNRQRLQGFAKITRDVTEAKKAGEQISYMARLMEDTGDAIISYDPYYIIRSWNKAAEDLYGFSMKEAMGRDITLLLKADISEKERQLIRATLVQHGSWKGEVVQITRDGRRIVAFVSVAETKNERGETDGYVMVCRDISERKKMEEQLRAFNHELEEKVKEKTAEITNIFDRVTDAFIAFDKEGKFTYVNKKAAELNKRKAEDLVGKNIWQEFPEEKNHAFYKNFQKAIATQQNLHFEMYSPTLGIWIENYIYPSTDGLSHFFRDITEQKKSEEKIRLSERKYKLLFESNPMPMWMISSADFSFIDVNNAALQHYGYTKEEFLSMKSTQIRPEADQNKYIEESKKRIPGLSHRGIWRHRKKDGTLISVEIYANDIEYEGKQVRLVLSNDVTNKLRIEEDLKKSYRDVQELASHLQVVREEERAVIAREIHDELGQQLTGLKMDIFWLSKKMADENEQVRQKINTTLALLDNTIKTVRKISTELRPSILDDLGLAAAMEWQSQEFEKRSGIVTSFRSAIDGYDFPSQTSIGLFRICQESLTNIARHAEAKNVSILLQHIDDQITLVIKDDGKGFNINKIGNKKTLGLIGMRERTLMMGGDFEMNSEPGMGTNLTIKVPVSKLAND